MTRATDLRARFLELHTSPPAQPTPGILVMPNPFDVGSAKVLAAAGAVALATTSAGHAGTLGRMDQHVTRDEVLTHVEAMTAATQLPLNVDSEDCFADAADGVAESAALFAATDAAGFSIEDYDPRTGTIRPTPVAAERVRAARSGGADLVLTARAENHLHGIDDLGDTIIRLTAYREAGADVLYAPGVTAPDDIARLVAAVEAPVNVLALPGTRRFPSSPHWVSPGSRSAASPPGPPTVPLRTWPANCSAPEPAGTRRMPSTLRFGPARSPDRVWGRGAYSTVA